MAINILVVDDSPVMRNMIIRTINLCGLEIGSIHEAGNGKEGLETLEKHWIDLLFIDVNMPVMDGMNMLNHVRNNRETKNTPVLIVSTESNEDRIKEINKRNAGFVHKPFTPETLRKKIQDMLGIMNK